MRPKPYNPCADGFAAKLWECLRRNEQFKDECKSWSNIKSKASWAATIARLESSISPAPLFAIVRHLFLGPDIWVPIEDHFKSLSLTLKKTWPELDADNREWIIWFDARGKLERAHIPNFTLPTKNQKRADADTDYFLIEARCFNDTHQLCYVPKFIWDSDHKKQIERQLNELLGKPIGNKKLLKPTGSTLGSEAEWDSYLRFEEWTQEGYGRGRACGLVAWEKYEAKSVRQDFGQTPKARKQAAADFLATSIGKKQPEKKDTVEGHVASIEKAIKSVFPLFVPFYCKQKKQ